MPHTLPALPYDFGALEPHIDTQTMQIHHGKHHQAYVNNLNAALDKHPELHQKSLDQLLQNLNSVPEAMAESHADTGARPAAAATIELSMSDNKFTPTQLTMKAGEATAINVENKGQALHNLRIIGLAGDAGKDAQTSLLAGGQSGGVTVTAPKAGSYKFVCDVHPTEMTGTLTVK